MKIILPTFSLIVLLTSTTMAQEYQSCANARTLCNKAPVTVPQLVQFSGSSDPAPTCFGSVIRWPYWFHFTPVTSGTIEFLIFPEIIGAADYDFALFLGCPPQGLELACDWAGPKAPTGVASNPGAFGTSFNPGILPFTITVEAGLDYYLLVDNYSQNGIGFTLEFAGSFQIAPTDPVGYPVENALSCTTAPLFDCTCLDGFSSGTRLTGGNQNFYRFEACSCAMAFSITIDGPCSIGNAIQVQVLNYDPSAGTCSPTPLPFSGQGTQANPCEITAYNLHQGQEYVLAINGLNGASCPYTIEVMPLEIPEPQVDTIFTPPATYCEGDTISYVVSQDSAVLTCYCHWTVPPGADTLQPAPNTLLVLAGHGDGLPHQVCVTTSTGCNDFITICREVTIFPDTTTDISALVCDRDLPYIFNGQTLNTAGLYFDTLQMASGCDSIIRLHLFVRICEDGGIQGDSDVCLEQTSTYSLTPPACSLLAPIGACSGDVCDCELCETETGIDSLLYLWHIPDCARFLGDSTGLQVTLVFDQCFFQSDTTVSDSIWVEIIPVYVHPDSLPADASNCNCFLNGPGCGGAISAFPVNIHFHTANAGPDQLLCLEDNPVQLQAGQVNPQFVYLWSTGAVGPATSLNQPAATIVTYGLTVTDPTTGCSATDEVIVNVAPAILRFLPPASICLGECFDFGGQMVCPQPGDSPLSATLPSSQFCDSIIVQEVYFLQPDTTDLGIVGTLTCAQSQVMHNGTIHTQAGTYLDQISPCQYERFSIDLNTTPPIAEAGPDQLLCLEENPVQLQAGQVNPQFVYLWSTGAVGPATSLNQPAATIVTYGLTVTDPATGCSASDEVTVNVAPAILRFLPPASICPGECFDFGGQMVCPQPGDSPLSATLPSSQFCDSIIVQEVYFLQPDTTDLGLVATLNCNQLQVIFHGNPYAQPGEYLLHPDPCTFERFRIEQDTALPMPVSAATECLPLSNEYLVHLVLPTGETWRINGIEASDGYSSEPVSSGQSYSLTLENIRNGCISVLEGEVVCIQNFEFYIPNVIHPASGSPNGYLSVYAQEGQVTQVNSLNVYDRWGGHVFSRTDFAPNTPELGWDGTARGKICPEGVYVYVCEILLANGHVEQRVGDVVVLR